MKLQSEALLQSARQQLQKHSLNMTTTAELTASGSTTLDRPIRPRRKGPNRATKPHVSDSSRASVPPQDVSPPKTSHILRKLLNDNQGSSITIQKIVDDLGPTSFGTSLMVFSIPELLPFHLPGAGLIVAVPNAILSSQMIRGKQKIQLPAYLLRRSIPRKVFAGAVKAILPTLEKIERSVKPSGQWVNHPLTKRLLGLFILILAGVIALPIPWTCTIAAISTMMIAMGMTEKNGKLVTLGILAGVGSIALVGGVLFGAVALIA